MINPQTSFAHLERLTTDLGLQEHALFSTPRPEHGYCVDDAARALVLLCRETQLDNIGLEMHQLFLDFILRAVTEDGSCHNRMDAAGNWIDLPGRGDWWGRAVWGLGFAAVHSPMEEQRSRALAGFRALARTSSPDLKAFSFASLGAGELLLACPDELSARRILKLARPRLLQRSLANWIWPEDRLTYSNGSVPEAAILIGFALDDLATLNKGFLLLEFLLENESRGGHFSVTPATGRGPEERGVGFDQQPIEIAAIADACARAWQITGRPRWANEVQRAWSWFLGNNDSGAIMFDPETGGGFDGLHAHGPNRNQGAESTISMLSTAQQARQTYISGQNSPVLTHGRPHGYSFPLAPEGRFLRKIV